MEFRRQNCPKGGAKCIFWTLCLLLPFLQIPSSRAQVDHRQFVDVVDVMKSQVFIGTEYERVSSKKDGSYYLPINNPYHDPKIKKLVTDVYKQAGLKDGKAIIRRIKNDFPDTSGQDLSAWHPSHLLKFIRRTQQLERSLPQRVKEGAQFPEFNLKEGKFKSSEFLGGKLHTAILLTVLGISSRTAKSLFDYYENGDIDEFYRAYDDFYEIFRDTVDSPDLWMKVAGSGLFETGVHSLSSGWDWGLHKGAEKFGLVQTQKAFKKLPKALQAEQILLRQHVDRYAIRPHMMTRNFVGQALGYVGFLGWEVFGEIHAETVRTCYQDTKLNLNPFDDNDSQRFAYISNFFKDPSLAGSYFDCALKVAVSIPKIRHVFQQSIKKWMTFDLFSTYLSLGVGAQLGSMGVTYFFASAGSRWGKVGAAIGSFIGVVVAALVKEIPSVNNFIGKLDQNWIVEPRAELDEIWMKTKITQLDPYNPHYKLRSSNYDLTDIKRIFAEYKEDAGSSYSDYIAIMNFNMGKVLKILKYNYSIPRQEIEIAEQLLNELPKEATKVQKLANRWEQQSAIMYFRNAYNKVDYLKAKKAVIEDAGEGKWIDLRDKIIKAFFPKKKGSKLDYAKEYKEDFTRQRAIEWFDSFIEIQKNKHPILLEYVSTTYKNEDGEEVETGHDQLVEHLKNEKIPFQAKDTLITVAAKKFLNKIENYEKKMDALKFIFQRTKNKHRALTPSEIPYYREKYKKMRVVNLKAFTSIYRKYPGLKDYIELKKKFALEKSSALDTSSVAKELADRKNLKLIYELYQTLQKLDSALSSLDIQLQEQEEKRINNLVGLKGIYNIIGGNREMSIENLLNKIKQIQKRRKANLLSTIKGTIGRFELEKYYKKKYPEYKYAYIYDFPNEHRYVLPLDEEIKALNNVIALNKTLTSKQISGLVLKLEEIINSDRHLYQINSVKTQIKNIKSSLTAMAGMTIKQIDQKIREFNGFNGRRMGRKIIIMASDTTEIDSTTLADDISDIHSYLEKQSPKEAKFLFSKLAAINVFNSSIDEDIPLHYDFFEKLNHYDNTLVSKGGGPSGEDIYQNHSFMVKLLYAISTHDEHLQRSLALLGDETSEAVQNMIKVRESLLRATRSAVERMQEVKNSWIYLYPVDGDPKIRSHNGEWQISQTDWERMSSKERYEYRGIRHFKGVKNHRDRLTLLNIIKKEWSLVNRVHRSFKDLLNFGELDYHFMSQKLSFLMQFGFKGAGFDEHNYLTKYGKHRRGKIKGVINVARSAVAHRVLERVGVAFREYYIKNGIRPEDITEKMRNKFYDTVGSRISDQERYFVLRKYGYSIGKIGAIIGKKEMSFNEQMKLASTAISNYCLKTNKNIEELEEHEVKKVLAEVGIEDLSLIMADWKNLIKKFGK